MLQEFDGVRINWRLARASPSLMTCSSESHCTTFESVNSHERNKIADKATQLSGFCCIYATWEFTHKGADVQQTSRTKYGFVCDFIPEGSRRKAAQIITLDDNLRRNPQSKSILNSTIFAHLFAQGGWGVVIMVLKELDKV